MSTLRRRHYSRPDELRELPGAVLNIFELAGGLASYSTFEPGWRWSTHVKPIAGTDYCDFHHAGFSLSGRVHIEHRDGAEMEIGPGEFFEITPHHDAWVVGDKAWVSVDWGSGISFGRQEGTVASRRLATLLFTDIVNSTVIAHDVGDARWRDILLRHNELVRVQLERFRGREVVTTGDGFLVLFDSAESAVHAALAIAQAIVPLGIEVRCGVHTGEIEHDGSNVRGLSVHVASRVLGLAGPSEVLVSWTTRDLLDGSSLSFDSRGSHELKGLPEGRPIYAVSSG